MINDRHVMNVLTTYCITIGLLCGQCDMGINGDCYSLGKEGGKLGGFRRGNLDKLWYTS